MMANERQILAREFENYVKTLKRSSWYDR
jgi:hypothetical protein